jgi:pimeloyl-ACP methyl ester carboxylesterase
MQKQFDYKGSKVSYLDEGDGNLIVLIHGFAEDASIWEGQTAFLSRYYRVIAVDIPGSGHSSYNPALTSMDDFADVMYALLAHENINRCIMLGHSLGGYITLAFAEKYPANLSGFGMVHSTAFADSDEKKLNREKGIKAIEEHGTLPFIRNTTPNLFSAGYKKVSAGKVEQLVEKGIGFTKEALQQYYAAMMTRLDRTGVLKNANVPVLFIAGAEDVVVPLSDTLKQVHMPALSHIYILEHSGHMGLWEEKNKTNESIEAFAGYIKHADN